MSITFPTLELGELGQALDDAIAEDPGIAAEEAPPPDAAPLEAGVSAVAAEPAAGAGAEPPTEPVAPEVDAEYAARFEADYAERSKADFAKLRSRLDRQITDLRSKHTLVSDAAEEAENYAAYLESKLAEYDPDEGTPVDGAQPVLVDAAKLAEGVQKLLEGTVGVGSQYLRDLFQSVATMDAGLVDADLADCIVQAAVLGEIRYG